MDSKVTLKWQIAGFIAIVPIGALLHFTYAWSGYNPIVGLFSPVNESVWEHFKIGFTALALFTAVEYSFIGKGSKQYFLAKALGVLSLQIFITIFFYIYTSFTGTDILSLDVVSFVMGCALCQLVVYRILNDQHVFGKANAVGIGLLGVHAVLLIVFTFWTPQKPLFQDPNRLTYGTEWHVDPEEREHDH